MTTYRAGSLLAAFLCFLACPGFLAFPGFLGVHSASAQEDAPRFYAGRNLTFVVGSTTGGGYDFNARAVARHMGKYIPGAPTTVVQNMPGAGSIVATNHVYNVAPQDGSVIGVVQRPIPFEPFFNEKGVRFDVRKMNWLGSTTSEVGVVVAWHTAPQRSFKDVLEREMIVGGNGPATDTELFARALNRELGAKFRIVGGYPGESQIILAMERGEVQGVANWSWNNIPAKHPDWLRDGKIRLLLQLGLRKHPALPDVPLILDLAKDADQRKLFETMMQMKELGRPYFAGPNVPADRIEILRAAFTKTMADADFVSEMTKAGISIDPVSGSAMEKLLSQTYSLPPELIARTRAALAN